MKPTISINVIGRRALTSYLFDHAHFSRSEINPERLPYCTVRIPDCLTPAITQNYRHVSPRRVISEAQFPGDEREARVEDADDLIQDSGVD